MVDGASSSLSGVIRDSLDGPYVRSSRIESPHLHLLSDEEDQSEYEKLRSSQNNNLNEILARMQVLSMQIETRTTN